MIILVRLHFCVLTAQHNSEAVNTQLFPTRKRCAFMCDRRISHSIRCTSMSFMQMNTIWVIDEHFHYFQDKMRTINSNQCVKIPRGIKASVNSRVVSITGPRGSLKRNFKHLALDIHLSSPRTLKVEKWFGTKKELAAVRTVCSHIQNMIKGKFAVGLRQRQRTRPVLTFISLRLFVSFICRCDKGFPIQDARSICPFPDQLCHIRRQLGHRDP